MKRPYQPTAADLLYERARDAQIPAATAHATRFGDRARAMVPAAKRSLTDNAKIAAIEALAFSNQMQRLAYEKRPRLGGEVCRLITTNPEKLATYRSEQKALEQFRDDVRARKARLAEAA